MQGCQRRLGRFIQNLQKRLGRPGWAAFALLPVTNRVQRDINALSEFDLAKSKPTANPARKFSCIQHSVSIILSLMLSNRNLCRGINTPARSM